MHKNISNPSLYESLRLEYDKLVSDAMRKALGQINSA